MYTLLEKMGWFVRHFALQANDPYKMKVGVQQLLNTTSHKKGLGCTTLFVGRDNSFSFFFEHRNFFSVSKYIEKVIIT